MNGSNVCLTIIALFTIWVIRLKFEERIKRQHSLANLRTTSVRYEMSDEEYNMAKMFIQMAGYDDMVKYLISEGGDNDGKSM